MSARIAGQRPLSLGWPLTVSGVATALVAGFVCSPPTHKLHSWAQIVSLATAYVLLAAGVHALAVWSVCRVREEGESASWRLVLSAIWAAWIVVVWLPLLALLTLEQSPWVSLILPVTAVFAVLLLRWQSANGKQELEPIALTPQALFRVDLDQSIAEPTALWRYLLPAIATVLALELGLVLLAAGHAWTAGCLFGIAVLYPLGRLQARKSQGMGQARHHRTSNRAATANSVVVWLLLVLALTPFMAAYTAGVLAGLLRIDTRAHGRPIGVPQIGHGSARGYIGLVLIPPPVNRILSTDHLPLIMEAHQKLVRPIAMSCCSSLRIDVTNADTVAGPIAVEVILHETPAHDVGGKGRPTKAPLGQQYLKTSLVSPMPLKRPPVEDSLSFQLPSYLHGRSIDGITVRIQPGRSRSLAGPQVSVKDFALQR